MDDNRPSDPRDRRLSLGRFAQATQLSQKALRLYDKVGILKPDYIDPNSGYRYYKTAQFEKARFIRLMREMEMPLAEIRSVLAAPTPEEALELTLSYQTTFEKKVSQVRQASQKALTYLRQEKFSNQYDISVELFPARQIISIKKKIAVPAFHSFIPQALSQLDATVVKQGAHISGDPICFFYGPVNEEDAGPVEIGFPVDGSVMPAGEILVRDVPAHQGVVGTASSEQSEFPAILELWSAVLSRTLTNRLNFSGSSISCYEIWHKDGRVSIVQPFENEP